jgi:TPR repeat protein
VTVQTHAARLCAPLLLALCLSACAQSASQTIRICDDSGCSERPRNSASWDPAADTNPEQTRRLQALSELARQDPRAAYDLGLRFYRGDGVEQNSHLALVWMRQAGERGDLQAQAALGRFYLAGLEEMGSDPAEAEAWLSRAAERGDKASQQLLVQARAAKKEEIEYRRWLDLHRSHWQAVWAHGYAYQWHWRSTGWVLLR